MEIHVGECYGKLIHSGNVGKICVVGKSTGTPVMQLVYIASMSFLKALIWAGPVPQQPPRTNGLNADSSLK
jgi:hypothetical protein